MSLKISVFGLGYVGCVSAACFAKEGFKVTGVDINPAKVEMINQGRSPIIEEKLEEFIREGIDNGLLLATTDTKSAVINTDLSFITVGTPSKENGDLDLTYIERVIEEIGKVLAAKNEYHLVVIRSTILPGTIEGVVLPLLEKYSGKKMGEAAYSVCMNPEFMREGSAIDDFYNPPKTIIGSFDHKAGELVAKVYKNIAAPLIFTSCLTAEMVKYTDNVFHALKICFANEIGNICKKLNIDSHEVMSVFCKDTKLNISSAYLKPGFAFGGSCLPKDVRALIYKGKILDMDLSLLNGIISSNQEQINIGIKQIIRTGKKKIGVIGFSFKAGTDDLRESPMVEVIERLLGKGYQLKLYDPEVSLARLVGVNKKYIMEHIPHISALMTEAIKEVIDFAEVIVIGNKFRQFEDIFKKAEKDQIIIDFVRISNNTDIKGKYEGISW